MKRISYGFIAVMALFSASLTLSGCATTQETPAQVLQRFNSQVCPILLATKTTIDALPVIDANLLASLKPAGTVVSRVCAPGAIVAATDLQTLATDSIPAILDVVKHLAVFPQQQAVIDGITAAQVILPIIIAQLKSIQ